MSEEQTITALVSLFNQVRTLKQINIADMLKPEIYQLYEESLQAAYDELTTVEDALTSLGMELEYEHWRLGGAVEELKPLMIQVRTPADRVIETYEQLQP